MEEEKEDTPYIGEDTKNDEEQVVEDTDADSKDVIEEVADDSAKDDAGIAEVKEMLSQVISAVNAIQAVLLENGARIVDVDTSDNDIANTDNEDGYTSLDALDLNLE